MLLIKTTLADAFQEVGGDVKGFQFGESSVLHGLSNDAGAGANIHADSVTGNAHATLFDALAALVDNVLGFSEVDNTGPLVVSLGGETSIPLFDVLLSGQMPIELVDNVAALCSLSRGGLGLVGGDALGDDDLGLLVFFSVLHN